VLTALVYCVLLSLGPYFEVPGPSFQTTLAPYSGLYSCCYLNC
jgi:hypothetical protein